MRIIFKIIILFLITSTLIIQGTSTIDKNIEKQKNYKIPEITGSIQKRTIIQNTFNGDDILISPYQGDDLLPSITKDLNGNTVITWTNKQNNNKTFWGIAYSNNPRDRQSWLADGKNYVLHFQSINNGMYWDTALIQGNEETYNGLAGCFISKDEELQGFYLINDITSNPIETQGDEWIIWLLENTNTPINTEIADGNSYLNKNHMEYGRGPFVFYVYTFDRIGYNITQCPIFTHYCLGEWQTGRMAVINYFDGQEKEKTAPADNPDYVHTDNQYHTVIQNMEYNKIIWKKIIPSEDPDYEYTSYQKSISNGTNPAIAAYEKNVTIVFTDENKIKCAYSHDDGENWNINEITNGYYPEICSIGKTLYATFIKDGNLYKITSKNAGETWENIEQINDIDGTVYVENDTVDIHESGIIWVDQRGEDLDIYYNALSDIQIDQISGGFGVSANITNHGNTELRNIKWNITLDGYIYRGVNTNGTIENLSPGDSEFIESSIPFGLGNIDINVKVELDNRILDVENVNGKLFFIYVKVEELI